MNLDQAMAELQSMGSVKNRKVFAHHGIREPMFGVSLKNVRALAKQIRRDNFLARNLWETENHDARMLATMIADPKTLSVHSLGDWVTEADNYIVCASVADFAVRAPNSWMLANAYLDDASEWVVTIGWNMVAIMAANPKGYKSALFPPLLGKLERTIAARQKWTRHAMNSALIALGTNRPDLAEACFEAAKRIGPIQIEGLPDRNAEELIGEAIEGWKKILMERAARRRAEQAAASAVAVQEAVETTESEAAEASTETVDEAAE